MKNAKNTRLHVWELALLLALAAAILWGAASLSRQEDLGRKVIRLHVIANSDSPEDQALKLRVRDRVLARAQELLDLRPAGADPGSPTGPGGGGLRRRRPGPAGAGGIPHQGL